MVFQKGQGGRKKGDATTFFLAQLDKKTRLYGSKNSFSIRKFNGAVWLAEYYYTTISGAITGYIKRELRNKKRMKTGGNIERLILAIKDLDNSVKELANKFEEKLTADPMFHLPSPTDDVPEDDLECEENEGDEEEQADETEKAIDLF